MFDLAAKRRSISDMKEEKHREPSELQPIYDAHELGAPIELSEESAKLIGEGVEIELKARIAFEFLPLPRVKVYADLPGAKPPCQVADCYDLRLPKRSLSIRVFASEIRAAQSSAGANTLLIMEPKVEPFTALGSGTDQVKKVIFHLVNFRDFCAQAIVVAPKPSESLRLDQIVLEAGRWRIRLSSMRTTKGKIKSLRAKGGYAITHVGEFERSDGSLFSEQEATNLISCLYYFLSFARGFWTAPVLSVGLNSSNEHVWEEWGARVTDRWANVWSWFDGAKGNLLAEIFPGFFRSWQHKMWCKPLSDAIYWYITANQANRGIDMGIVLAHASLELLAWNYAVKDRRLISEKGFKDIWASDEFRLLLSSLNVPLEIPSHLKNLSKLAKTCRFVDAPQALSEIRNSIVHPKKKVAPSPDELYEAWNLSLWYVELVLLRLFGYQGEYSNRLAPGWRGQYESVPCATVKLLKS